MSVYREAAKGEDVSYVGMLEVACRKFRETGQFPALVATSKVSSAAPHKTGNIVGGGRQASNGW
jgi:hypothetical protein